MPALNIVLAEDDPSIRTLVAHHLQQERYEVTQVHDGNAALRAARTVGDALILDVGLPAIDGFEVARTLRRERCTIPIIMLTARIDEVDRVVGLEIGADDYICKPFAPREVVARLKAVLRRSSGVQHHRSAVIALGRIEIHEAAREVRIDAVHVAFKPREFSLLVMLVREAGIAFSRRTLLERVWGLDFDGDERTVDVHVRRIRQKLDEHAGLSAMLQTVHGFGYKFARP